MNDPKRFAEGHKQREQKVCSIGGCGMVVRGHAFCGKHYHRFKAYGDPLFTKLVRKPREVVSCSVNGCERISLAKGLCGCHYARNRKYGDPLFTKYERKTKKLNTQGYVFWTDNTHPLAGDTGMLLEHRVVMANVLGRKLFPKESVHHMNGDRADNRPDNLELWSTSQPPGQRVEDKQQWAIEFLRQYGFLVVEPMAAGSALRSQFATDSSHSLN